MAVVIGLSISCQAETPYREIEKAALACPLSNKDACLPGSSLSVKIVKIQGDFAKATVSRTDGSGETETVYLQETDGQWLVLDEGTGIDPSQIGIPKELW